jgi:hypothetical protein
VFHGHNLDPIFLFLEEQSVISHAKPEFGWVYSLKALDITLESGQIASQSAKDAQGCLLIDGPELGLRAICPDGMGPAHEASLFAGKI